MPWAADRAFAGHSAKLPRAEPLPPPARGAFQNFTFSERSRKFAKEPTGVKIYAGLRMKAA